MLSLGALLTYLVLLVQRIETEASVVRKIGSLQAHQSLRLRLKRLTFVFFLFVGSWIAHLFAGAAGHVLFHVAMIVLGIVSVTLSAHTHSRPSSTRFL
jgi:hypothetical protein